MAQAVNGVQLKADRPGSERIAQAAELGRALNLDMAAWFTPTAANYFSRISKAGIIVDMSKYFDIENSQAMWFELTNLIMGAEADLHLAQTFKALEPAKEAFFR